MATEREPESGFDLSADLQGKAPTVQVEPSPRPAISFTSSDTAVVRRTKLSIKEAVWFLDGIRVVEPAQVEVVVEVIIRKRGQS